MSGLGLDAGGSATRWALCDAGGAVLAAGESAPVTGHLFNPAERAKLEAMAATLAATLAEPLAGRPLDGVVAGITGLSPDAPEAAVAAELLAPALGLPAARIRVHDDMWIAYHAVFAPGEGHVVYAGSGSIGAHIRADGSEIRVGGRGMLVDDAGSAFWIGREALNLVWRRLDADPAACGRLAGELAAAIGEASWNAARSYVYGGGRAAVAMLARAVARADDADARAILHAAGCELARLAQALVQRVGEKPVALIGRAASLHPAIESGFRQAVPHLQVRLATPDAAVAAARLAAGLPSGQADANTTRGE